MLRKWLNDPANAHRLLPLPVGVSGYCVDICRGWFVNNAVLDDYCFIGTSLQEIMIKIYEYCWIHLQWAPTIPVNEGGSIQPVNLFTHPPGSLVFLWEDRDSEPMSAEELENYVIDELLTRKIKLFGLIPGFPAIHASRLGPSALFCDINW